MDHAPWATAKGLETEVQGWLRCRSPAESNKSRPGEGRAEGAHDGGRLPMLSIAHSLPSHCPLPPRRWPGPLPPPPTAAPPAGVAAAGPWLPLAALLRPAAAPAAASAPAAAPPATAAAAQGSAEGRPVVKYLRLERVRVRHYYATQRLPPGMQLAGCSSAAGAQPAAPSTHLEAVQLVGDSHVDLRQRLGLRLKGVQDVLRQRSSKFTPIGTHLSAFEPPALKAGKQGAPSCHHLELVVPKLLLRHLALLQSCFLAPASQETGAQRPQLLRRAEWWRREISFPAC